MAISFSDLRTEAGLKALEGFLSGKTYISGDQISKDDVKVFAAVAKPGDGFPNVFRWYESVYGILAPRFPGKALGVKVGSQAAVSAPAPPAEASKASDDDDDLDLFGDETEEEKKAAEEREAAVKASSKKKESGKSSVLLDIKPWDDETDMKKLEEAVRSLEMPGLLWGASKLVPVGYGIKKLQIMMTIVDDLVSVDSLIEEELTVEPRNEYIQSCDIVAFNKI
ncbi:Elongation factor [Musa troglodytarum]|uniref:Elongation factor n=1 Tax=Musa troglodytarum TaxID=320322 RepID=A0A9E7EHK5_9LILI|nr:Elongation factor [Musa troglodytarum]